MKYVRKAEKPKYIRRIKECVQECVDLGLLTRTEADWALFPVENSREKDMHATLTILTALLRTTKPANKAKEKSA